MLRYFERSRLPKLQYAVAHGTDLIDHPPRRERSTAGSKPFSGCCASLRREHQQQPAIPERTDQARNRIIGANLETEHLRYGTGDQPGLGERRQIDEPDPMFISVD